MCLQNHAIMETINQLEINVAINRNKSTDLLYTQINWILSTGNTGLN